MLFGLPLKIALKMVLAGAFPGNWVLDSLRKYAHFIHTKLCHLDGGLSLAETALLPWKVQIVLVANKGTFGNCRCRELVAILLLFLFCIISTKDPMRNKNIVAVDMEIILPWLLYCC